MAGVRRVVSTDRARSRSDFRDRDSELRDADDDVVEEDDDGFSGDSSYRLFKLFPVYFFWIFIFPKISDETAKMG